MYLNRFRTIGTLILILSASIAAFGKVQSTTSRNSALDDVAIGTEAANGIRAALPLLKDDEINAYVGEIGRRLVESLPNPLQHPGFRYSFDVIDQMFATSYALPGGPVFVIRELVQSAASEPELALRIARDVSHIALRHGTMQAAAGQAYGIGTIRGADIAAVIAGPQQGILTQGERFGVVTYFLFYNQEFERQATQLASELVSRAGYDRPSDRLSRIQARLREIRRTASVTGETVAAAPARIGVVVPSGEFRVVTAGEALALSVPGNWARVSASSALTFAPDAAVVRNPGGAPLVTHGVQLGVARSLTNDLQKDTESLLEVLSRGGRSVVWRPSFQNTMLAGRPALTTALVNVSAATGAFEQVMVCTAHLPNGGLIYLIGVWPQDEAGPYRIAFDRVRASIRRLR